MQSIFAASPGFVAPSKVAVFRALQLGDLLCAVPALRALRAALPDAEIVLVGLPWARAFVERFSRYLDRFIEFPGYPGLPEIPPRLTVLPDFLAQVQAERFDLALQMHGSGIVTNPLTVLFGARYTAGFFLPGNYCPDPERFLPLPAQEPEPWKLLRLMQFLGVPLQGEHLEFPLLAGDCQELAQIGEARILRAGHYVCIHPGARAEERRWSADSFAEVGDRLAQRGLQIVLTGSTDEAALAGEVQHRLRTPCINLAGRTSLGALAALLSQCRLLVCNDTGVSHLAAGLQVPSVVVFHRSDREGWPPQDRQRHRVVCRLGGVMPEDVLAQADDLLRHPYSSSPNPSLGTSFSANPFRPDERNGASPTGMPKNEFGNEASPRHATRNHPQESQPSCAPSAS